MKFEVREKVTFETHDPMLGRIRVKFDKGPVEPKSEQEEAALRALVDLKLAKVVSSEDPPSEKSKRNGKGK